MVKQKFYETVDKYLMAMGIDIEEYADLQDVTVKWMAVQTALECSSMFDVAWDCDPCNQEEEGYMRMCAPDLDDPAIEDKLRILFEQRDASLAAQG